MRTLTRTFAVLATIAYAASLTSCSKDGGAGPRGGENNEKAYIAVNVSARADTPAGFRAEGDEVTGTDAESKTHTIHVVLYDDNNTVKYAWTTPSGITYGANGQPQHADIIEEAGSTATNFSMKAQQVDEQIYRLLVLINPTAEALAATAEGASLADFLAPTADGVATVAKLTGAGGFLMSNAEGLVNILPARLSPDAETAEMVANRVAVRVDRAVAKVAVKGPASFDTDESGAELLAWNLDVTNKSMFWMRKQTNGVMPGGEVTPEVISAGNFLPRVNRYAEDPNFTGRSYDAWVAAGSPAPPRTDADYPYHFFNYLQNPATTVTKAIPETLDRESADDYLYCLENTMAATEQWQDVTTSVIVKAKWWPKMSSLAGGDTFVEDDPYFVYTAAGSSFVFSAAELDDIALGADGGGIDLDATEFPALTGMKNDLGAIKSAGGAFDGIADFATFTSATSVREGNLAYNADNVNYYRVPIRHFSNDIQPVSMAYGRFGVVRNNIYELTVNSISGPGRITVNTDPTDPENPDDPDEPDEKTNAYIDVTINILPWVLREQQVDL
jgi:hypothetical protein